MRESAIRRRLDAFRQYQQADMKRARWARLCVDAFKRAYPVGSAATYQHGRYWHAVQVVEHGYGERLLVRNNDTGRQYWVNGSLFVGPGDRREHWRRR